MSQCFLSHARVLVGLLSMIGASLWFTGDALGANDALLRRFHAAMVAHRAWLEPGGEKGHRLDLVKLWEPHELWIETAGEEGDRGD